FISFSTHCRLLVCLASFLGNDRKELSANVDYHKNVSVISMTPTTQQRPSNASTNISSTVYRQPSSSSLVTAPRVTTVTSPSVVKGFGQQNQKDNNQSLKKRKNEYNTPLLSTSNHSSSSPVSKD